MSRAAIERCYAAFARLDGAARVKRFLERG
jgi:hypothetical protein